MFKNETLYYDSWWPVTLLYLDRPNTVFEIFARSVSTTKFNQIKCMFDIEGKQSIQVLFDALRARDFRLPRWEHRSLDLERLMGFKDIAARK